MDYNALLEQSAAQQDLIGKLERQNEFLTNIQNQEID
jgi:hypothetical protein